MMTIILRCQNCNRPLAFESGPQAMGLHLFVEPCECQKPYRTIVGRPETIEAIEGLIQRGDVAYFVFEKADGTIRQLRGRAILWNENRHGRYENILVAESEDSDDDPCLRTICLERLQSIDFGGVKYQVQL